MIITEQFTLNGHNFVRTYSNNGFLIHGGSPEGYYSEACDPVEFGRTYTETDIPVEDEYLSDSEALAAILEALGQ